MNEPRLNIPADLNWLVEFYSAKCDSMTEFTFHLKVHIREGQAFTYPFKQCEKTFTVSAFNSHVSRNLFFLKVHLEIWRIPSFPEQMQVELRHSYWKWFAVFHVAWWCWLMSTWRLAQKILIDYFWGILPSLFPKLQEKLLSAYTVQIIIQDMQSIHEICNYNIF